MLPDKPNLKSLFHEELTRYLHQQVQRKLTGFARAPRNRVFEGRRTVIERSTGDKDETNFESAEGILSFDHAEIPELTLLDVLARCEEAAQSMADQIARNMYRTIGDKLDKAGRTLDRKGGPLDAESVLYTLDQLLIPFDEKGNAQFPEIHIHPDMEETLKSELKRLEEDPSLRKRLEEIISKKREEWRATESSRNLVG